MSNLNISSLNVRGCGDTKKRRQVFLWLREKSFNIYFLQETHSTRDCEYIWKNEWGYQVLYTHGSSMSKGVAILFNNNFPLVINKTWSDDEGRCIICDITVNDRRIVLCNIYAPNNDQPSFFEKVFDILEGDFPEGERIIGGDFNLVCDVHLDKKGGNPSTHFRSQEVIRQKSELFDLSDVWRVLHPNVRRYTWRQKTPPVHCRLDYFLLSHS